MRLRFLNWVLLFPMTSFAGWVPVSDIGSAEVYSVYAAGDTLVAGGLSSSWFSVNAGKDWQEGGETDPDAGGINTFVFHNGWLYAGTMTAGVYRSQDLGKTWVPVNPGLVGGAKRVLKLISGNGWILAGTDGAGLYRWPGTEPVVWSAWAEDTGRQNISEIFFTGSEFLMTSGFLNYVFRRKPGNPEWAASKLDTALGEILDIHSFARLGSDLFAGTSNGIYRSKDDGATWAWCGTRFLKGDVRQLRVNGSELSGIYVFDSDFFVVYSRDSGETWAVWDHWYLTVTAYDICRGTHWVGHIGGLSSGGSIPVSVQDPAAVPGPFPFLTGYPNPFNPETVLQTELPVSGPVSLRIYDLTGKLVADLASGVFPAGHHQFRWSAGRQSSGVYLARLVTGSGTATRRLVLLR
ncbi:MAG: T9SS type A sorting domain-containing protein [Bacteroidetes bacterium]|nr:T9SS type A sorting domain-containing protein [Bacteroidota bacterium]